jgi:hypothetical protein
MLREQTAEQTRQIVARTVRPLATRIEAERKRTSVVVLTSARAIDFED